MHAAAALGDKGGGKLRVAIKSYLMGEIMTKESELAECPIEKTPIRTQKQPRKRTKSDTDDDDFESAQSNDGSAELSDLEIPRDAQVL